MTATPAPLTRPPFFCLCEEHNTHIVLTQDGWYNSDTEVTYPFDSPTGKFYDQKAEQTVHCQAEKKLEEMRKTYTEWDVLLEWEGENPLDEKPGDRSELFYF